MLTQRKTSYYNTPKHPFRDALKAISGGKTPPKFVRGWSTKGYTDAEQQELHEWASTNVRPYWATGIGAIEAAELIVSEAVANNNILPDPEKT